ncbi:type II secretion system protein GspD, partial [Fervidobacterium sp.]
VGTSEQIENVKKLVSGIKVEEEVKVIETKLEEKEIGTIVTIYDSKVRYYKVGEKVYLIGKKESVEKITKEIEQFNADSEFNIIDGKLLIEVKGKSIGELIMKVGSIFNEQVILIDEFKDNVSLRIVVPDFKTLIENLQSYGVQFKQDNGVYIITSTAKTSVSTTSTQQTSAQATQPEEVIVKDGLISINASNKNVADLVAQVLSKFGKSYKIDNIQTKIHTLNLNNIDYETFKAVFSEWVEIREVGNVVYVSQISTIKDSKVSVKNGRIDVKIDNEPLGNVIKTIFESFGHSIIFAKNIDKTATISVSNIDLDTFTSILLNYGISIKKSGNVYVVDTTPEATKTRTTYTFNVTRGADKVKELIEFYGGKAILNTDAGLIVAYDLDPKNVDDINNMINKISKIRTVLIEAKVIDESLLSGLGYDISTLLKSADYISIGTGGLSLKFKITDLMDIQELWNKIIDNAELSLNTSSLTVPANQTRGSGKLLANPNIIAKSGEEARIFIGDSIPIRVKTQDGEQVNYLEAGIELKITPNINLDETIDLNLYTSVGNFDYTVVIGGLPKQNKREVSTKITLTNGQTIIIGGLAREEVSKSEWKIPILGDLPIIGWLFRGEQQKTEQRNIVIFLTAKIIE